jgi:tRNA nucleotidyltransferase (CCA-adding enzyme)
MSPDVPRVRSARDCLVLNENERNIFALLKECCQSRNLDVTLRVAGGWVRDKLLGLECHDCDIAIDKMMGQQFAEHFHSHLQHRAIPTSAYGIIQANPEKSKHLETATLTLHGYPVDFVNLRSESYGVLSRIPTIQFGTPLEDALRRDITINSLFYNIHNDEVEDYCGTGFEDLERGLVRTPLPPKETLMDDPLRLLRVVRFATRLQFRVDEALEAAIGDPNVDAAFRGKISRERVGIEMEKILSDAHAFEGMCMLHRLGVFNLIFDIPENVKVGKLPTQNQIATILRVLNQIVTSLTELPPQYNRRLTLLCAALIPHNEVFVERPLKKAEALSMIIVRDSLKFSSQDMTEVVQLLTPLNEIVKLVIEMKPDRIVIGRLIKRLGPHWETAFHMAIIYAVYHGIQPEGVETISKYFALIKLIYEWGLDQAWKWTGLLSGIDLKSLLGIQQGRLIGILIQELLDWQYGNPHGDKSQAADHIVKFFATLEL